MAFRRLAQRLHPRLTDILNTLDGSPLGGAFRDRAVEIASSAAFAELIDHRGALAPHRWVLE